MRLEEGCTVEHFRQEVAKGREPVLVRGLPLGPCLDLWTPEHLMQQGGDKEVSVHVSAHDRMDFITKNFQYQTLPFDELIARAAGARMQPPAENECGAAHGPAEDEAGPRHAGESRSGGTGAGDHWASDTTNAASDTTNADGNPAHQQSATAAAAASGAAPGGFFLHHEEKYYLRALGADPRKSIANLATDFPSLAKEISTSGLCEEDRFFSSVLRVGSAGIHLWTHYDVMDNALIQVSLPWPRA